MRALAIFAAALLAAPAAWAHSFLERASPAVGSEIPGPPPTVSLSYTEAVEPAFSSIQVTDASGVRVDTGRPFVEQNGRMLMVKLNVLPPGVYSVAWHAVSVDTHKTEGRYSFTVKP